MLTSPKVLLLSGDKTEVARWDDVFRHHAMLRKVSNLPELQHSLEVDSYDALLCEWSFQAGSWNDALEQVRRQCPDLPVIILCKKGNEREWFKVLEAGAFDLLVAPFLDHKVLPVLEHAVSTLEARRLHKIPCFPSAWQAEREVV